MELRIYWQLFIKWLWLIVLTTVVAAAAAYLVSIRQTPIYQASVRLRVVQGSGTNLVDTYQDILLSERLSRTYASMMTTREVMSQVLERVGLVDEDPEILAKAITVQPVRDTQLTELKVEYDVPQLAAEIANTLPEVFIAYNEQQQTARFQSSKQALQEELATLDKEIKETDSALTALGDLNDPNTQAQQSLLENRLAQYRSSYGNVLSQLEQIRLAEATSTDTLVVIEQATVPQTPVRPRILMNTLLAAIVGAMLGLGAAFLIEYLDDSVKSPDDITRVSGLSTLGVIVRHKKNGDCSLISRDEPRSPVTEAFRSIRTAIQFAGVDNPIRLLLVTSSGPSEGKSTVAANLAVVMAQTGKRVVLVDADLRKPMQHRYWDLPNTVGLTGALFFEQEPEEIQKILEETPIPGLWVIPSGQKPHNPSELLGSKKMKQFLDRLLQDFDVVIIDSPPALVVTDPVILAPITDGVLIVTETGSTSEQALVQTTEALRNVGAYIIGAVLNRFGGRGRRGYYYGGYYYYHSYYEDDGDRQNGNEKSKRRRKRTRSQQESTA